MYAQMKCEPRSLAVFCSVGTLLWEMWKSWEMGNNSRKCKIYQEKPWKHHRTPGNSWLSNGIYCIFDLFLGLLHRIVWQRRPSTVGQFHSAFRVVIFIDIMIWFNNWSSIHDLQVQRNGASMPPTRWDCISLPSWSIQPMQCMISGCRRTHWRSAIVTWRHAASSTQDDLSRSIHPLANAVRHLYPAFCQLADKKPPG